MARLDEYTFLVSNLLTGEIISVVELSSFYWEEIYNRPGAGLATARFELPTTTQENFKDWSNALWAIKDGVIQWGGIIGKVQRRGATRVISIPIIGFFEYFRNRILRDATGMNYGTLEKISDITWRNVDQFHIVEDLIAHVQDPFFKDGNINVGVTWDNLSGNLTTMIYRTFTTKFVGPIITTLSGRLDGFDFKQVYRFEGDQPRCDFKLINPPHSVVSGHSLLFQPEREIDQQETLLRAMDIDGASGSYAKEGNVTSITGDLEIIVQLAMDDWAPEDSTTYPSPTTYPGATTYPGFVSIPPQTLRSKWGTAGNKSYRFQILKTGHLRFEWTQDGITVQQVDSDFPVTFLTNDIGTVRVRMDVDDGNGGFLVSFAESYDSGVTWTPLTTVTGDPYETTYSVLY